jgi:DNA repair exonuclease SbcCD nuclease subunit
MKYLAMAAMIAVYLIAGNHDLHDLQSQDAEYCELVDIWRQTGGDFGVPPYRGECDAP